MDFELRESHRSSRAGVHARPENQGFLHSRAEAASGGHLKLTDNPQYLSNIIQSPGLANLMTMLRAGDTVVIWRLDRLGRSLKNLIELVERLEAAKVGLRCLQENIDATSSGGRLVFHLFGALAEFERNLIRERTQAGLFAARARGRMG